MSFDHSSPTARWRWVVILLIRRSGLSAKINVALVSFNSRLQIAATLCLLVTESLYLMLSGLDSASFMTLHKQKKKAADSLRHFTISTSNRHVCSRWGQLEIISAEIREGRQDNKCKYELA